MTTLASSSSSEGRSSELAIDGMNCQSCARKATEALQGVPGVARVAVQLEQGRASVSWTAAGLPDELALVEAIRKAGFKAKLEEIQESGLKAKPSRSLGGWRFNVILGSALTLPLLVGEWVFGWGHERWFQWLSLGLALPVQFLAGARFYRGAWNQIKVGQSSMDTLVALGSTTAFGYSLVSLLSGWHGHVYFMEAAAIITLISLGHWLEAMATARAGQSLRALMELAPPKALRLAPDGREVEVEAAALRVGDRILVRPGDRIPTDGMVEQGSSQVDESMLTGESMPVQKAHRSEVYGGTVNGLGRLLLRATRTGQGTALAQIIAAVQRAQTSRAGVQRLADRISNVFVPVVVAVALATGLFWGLAFSTASSWHTWLGQYLWPAQVPSGAAAAAFIHAAAVLIVACPCALGLATPAAIMAAANVAARRGILIRDGVALEKSGRITSVLFDKTGTLTLGTPVLIEAKDLRPASEQARSILAVAAELARSSSHPASRAIVAAAREREPDSGSAHQPDQAQETGRAAPGASPGHAGRGGLRGRQSEVDFAVAGLKPTRPTSSPGEGTWLTSSRPVPRPAQWTEVPGSGIERRMAGDATSPVMRLGSRTWLEGCGVQWLDDASIQGPERDAGRVGLAEGGRLLAVFSVRDSIKPDAAAVVARLQRAGKQVCLVTGDSLTVAQVIAGEVGVSADHVFAGVRPEDKAGLVRKLQARGERVAFVGDGINDAPALEQADLGVAVGKASDVARESADLVLMRSDLEAVPEAMALAERALRTIRQNLFWAFFYNVAAVPLAAMGFLSPVVCALAMGLSDLVVIGNALRLGIRRSE